MVSHDQVLLCSGKCSVFMVKWADKIVVLM